MTIETDANALDGPAQVEPVRDDSPIKIGDGFGDGFEGFSACKAACQAFPGALPYYGINAKPSRSAVPASARNWQWSILLSDTPGKPRIDWAQFNPLPTDGEFMRNLKEARKLLALRIDRGAPDFMIETARMGLEGIEQKIHAAVAARETKPAQGLVANMSPAVRAAAGLSMVAYFAVFLLKHGLHPIPYVPPPRPAPIPGPGVGMGEVNIFIPDQDTTKARTPSTTVRYSAPYTTTHQGRTGTTSTTHGARTTTTSRY